MDGFGIFGSQTAQWFFFFFWCWGFNECEVRLGFERDRWGSSDLRQSGLGKEGRDSAGYLSFGCSCKT